jgi:hypothetical protein
LSQHSIIDTRLWKWLQACSIWGFDIEPPFKEASLSGLPAGVVLFRASRSAVVDGEETTITLDVAEAWLEGDDPSGDRRLDAEACHLGALAWHAQVGADSGDRGAERLDVVPEAEATHPRIHQHPYGEVNGVRLTANLAEPLGWLTALNARLGGGFDDGLQNWDRLGDEEDETDEEE